MASNKCCFLFLILFCGQFVNAQTVVIKGQVIANDAVDGIHILNNTSKTFTISNSNGEFTMPVNLNDTLKFTGVSYESQKVVVGRDLMGSKFLILYLKEKINVLDEVVVGSVLTGDLSADLGTSGVKRGVNFFDFGIPGYAGKPKTQSERRLYTAGDFKAIHLLGLLGGSLEIDPILNAISGRTKAMKSRVHFESQEECLNKIKSRLSAVVFSDNALDEIYRDQFFYYCAEDLRFDDLCAEKNDFQTFEFLQEKLVNFKLNLKTFSE